MESNEYSQKTSCHFLTSLTSGQKSDQILIFLMILSVCCLKRFQLLKKMPNGAVFKPLKAIFVGTAVFCMSNTIINHVLKPKL